MIVGEHKLERDIEMNAIKAKQLNNIRQKGKDLDLMYGLKKPKTIFLEDAISMIKPDELVEVTPKAIRLRKKILTASGRARAKHSVK